MPDDDYDKIRIIIDQQLTSLYFKGLILENANSDMIYEYNDAGKLKQIITGNYKFKKDFNQKQYKTITSNNSLKVEKYDRFNDVKIEYEKSQDGTLQTQKI